MKFHEIKHTLSIILATQREQARSEAAYLANFWSEIFTAVIFITTQTIFINLLFRRAGLIAGYSRNDFFFLMLINQVTYFSTTRFLALPMYDLVDGVRFGNFDFVLLRPVSLLPYLYAKAIKPVSMLVATAPSLIIFGILVDWSRISVTTSSVVAGMAVWIAGFIIFRTFIFALAYPVFTEGDATDSLSGFYWTSAMNEMPYQKLPQYMKSLSLFLMPTLLMTAGTVAVILQKGSTKSIVIPSVVASFISILIYRVMWKHALSNYTSASS